MPVLLTICDHGLDLLIVRHVSFSGVLEECLALVLSDLKLTLAAGVQQVVDGLVVDLDVLALDFEVKLVNAFVLEHLLVVQCLLAR